MRVDGQHSERLAQCFGACQEIPPEGHMTADPVPKLVGRHGGDHVGRCRRDARLPVVGEYHPHASNAARAATLKPLTNIRP